MKKFMTVLLVAMLVLSCSITAFATPAANLEAALEMAESQK